MATVVHEWAKVDLTINHTKTKLFCQCPQTAHAVPANWQDSLVATLPVLGHKLRQQLDRDSPAHFVLGAAPSLTNTYTQLETLHNKLRELVPYGLTFQSAHDIWLHCSRGVTTHHFSTTIFSTDTLAELDSLQLRHLRWLTNRPADETLHKLASTAEGINLPNYRTTAPAIFLAAQARLVPRTVHYLSLASPSELFSIWPTLREDLSLAKNALRHQQ